MTLRDDVWEEWPRKGENASLSGAIIAAIDRYSTLVLRLGHTQARDVALASVLSDCLRPGVKRSGMLTGEKE